MASQSIYELPASLRDDLEQMGQMSAQFQQGTIAAPRFQAFRVPQGVYEQRESGTYMLRVRLPAGILLPAQLRRAAEVATTYGNGTLHFTSRQDLQIHGVRLEGIHPALVQLADGGLSTKGGGGNTVRNIAACHRAGICADETFDVTPHVVQLTEYLLPDPLSYQLPRKYKIACSSCGQDCAGATINDLGFVARERQGTPGFAVYVGGGMGGQSRVGQLLEEFIPTAAACHVAEAVKRVFDKHGNRKNRHRARIRFLLEDLGLAKFQELYRAELAGLQCSPTPALRPVEFLPPKAPARAARSHPADGFAAWRRTHVAPQKQAGYMTVEIPRPLDPIAADKLRGLADTVERYGEGVLRATQWQNAVLRWVPEADLPHLHAELAARGFAGSAPPILRHLVACAGASTCRLGIGLARGLAHAIHTALLHSNLRLDGATGNLRLHISGCPNACGRHPIAQIGFYGAARRVHGHMVPHYVLQLGGHVEEGKTTLATGNQAIPARNVPAFLVEFLHAFEQSSQHPNFAAFLAADGRTLAGKIAAKHTAVPTLEQDKNYYYDWGSPVQFSLAGRGPGECGAGVFDLIEVDLASAAEALSAGRLLAATTLAARALLVTRGEQADGDLAALTLFRKHFVETNVISAELHPVIDQALAATTGTAPAFAIPTADVAALLAAVRKLYTDMGPSLRVPIAACGVPPTPAAVSAELPPADLAEDLRSASCPHNYVKTQMALARLQSGQVLAVLLDDDGAQNVPSSAANDGHTILTISKQTDHWRVLIRKGS